MTAASGAHWTVRLDYSHAMAGALAVRDALGIADVNGLPPVAPAPRLHVNPSGNFPGLNEQWRSWWRRLVTAENATAAEGRSAIQHAGIPTPSSPIGLLVRENEERLRQWSAARKREVGEASKSSHSPLRLRHVMRSYEAETGREVGSFHIDVIALPLAGKVLIPRASGDAFVSINLFADREAYLYRLLDHITAG